MPTPTQKDQLLTSFSAGALLQVDPTTIRNWVNAGHLRAFRTPGGHRRIRADDLVAFLERRDMPIPPELQSADQARVLWIEPEPQERRALRRFAEGLPVDVEVVACGVDGLLHLGRRPPDRLVVELDLPDIDGLTLLRRLRADPELGGLHIVVMGSAQTGPRVRQAKGLAHEYLLKPARAHHLHQALGVSPTEKEGR